MLYQEDCSEGGKMANGTDELDPTNMRAFLEMANQSSKQSLMQSLAEGTII